MVVLRLEKLTPLRGYAEKGLIGGLYETPDYSDVCWALETNEEAGLWWLSWGTAGVAPAVMYHGKRVYLKTDGKVYQQTLVPGGANQLPSHLLWDGRFHDEELGEIRAQGM